MLVLLIWAIPPAPTPRVSTRSWQGNMEVLMDAGGEREALTADHHFEQAGFVRLLKS